MDLPNELSRRRVSPISLIYILLSAMAYVALFRSTAMGYGYPQYQDQMGEADYTMLAVLNYGLAALGAAYIVLDAAFLTRLVINSPAVVIGCILLIPTFVGSEDPVYSLRASFVIFVVTLPLIAYWARFGTDKLFDLLCHFCIATIFLNLLYIAAFPHFGIMGGGQGVRGLFPHKNMFGPFMAIAFVIVLPRFRRWDIGTLIACVALVIAAVFVALSRSASAVLMLAAAFIVRFGPRFVLLARHRSICWIAIAGFVVIASATILCIYLFFFDAVLAVLGRDATLTNCTRMWRVLFGVAGDDPYFGHGFSVFSNPSTFMRYWSAFGWNAELTHNSYLELLLNIGYIGAAYWMFIFLIVAWKNLAGHVGRSANIVKQQVILIMILISALTQAKHFFSGSFFWLALLASLFPAMKLYNRRLPSARSVGGIAPLRGQTRVKFKQHRVATSKQSELYRRI